VISAYNIDRTRLFTAYGDLFTVFYVNSICIRRITNSSAGISAKDISNDRPFESFRDFQTVFSTIVDNISKIHTSDLETTGKKLHASRKMADIQPKNFTRIHLY